MTEEPVINKKHYVYDFEKDRQNKIWAFIILSLSLFTFFLTIIGFTDGVSEMVALFLENKLGFTNKWSSTYGPDWWVRANRDIAALSGKIILLVFSLIFIGYFTIRRKQRRLWKFMFIFFGGAAIMTTFKIIFAEELPYEPFHFITTTVSDYPSGHAMMGTIFYLTLAVYITRAQHTLKTKRYTLIAGSILVVLIGFSRFLIGNHTVTEVLAGWSLGMIWLCICWFLDRYIKKKRRESR
jgi:undecaprenyl-diphosphatase